MTTPELVESYLKVVPTVWTEIKGMLIGLDVTMIEDATASDLANALASHEVVALLAHHVEMPNGNSLGIELCDEVLNKHSMAAIAPTRPTIVHLGVCRSTGFIEMLKMRCSQVRVISSQAQVEPEFFLRIFAQTVRLWRRDGGDYAQTHIRLRMAMLDALEHHPK